MGNMALPRLPLIIDPFSCVLVFPWQGRVRDGHVLVLAHLAQSFCECWQGNGPSSSMVWKVFVFSKLKTKTFERVG